MFELIQAVGSSYFIESPAKIGLVELGGGDVCLKVNKPVLFPVTEKGSFQRIGLRVIVLPKADGRQNVHAHMYHYNRRAPFVQAPPLAAGKFVSEHFGLKFKFYGGPRVDRRGPPYYNNPCEKILI